MGELVVCLGRRAYTSTCSASPRYAPTAASVPTFDRYGALLARTHPAADAGNHLAAEPVFVAGF